MLPPGGKDRGGFLIIIVAASNADPYPQQDAAIAALGALFGLTLDRDRCHPYSPHASACLGVPPANDVGSWHTCPVDGGAALATASRIEAVSAG